MNDEQLVQAFWTLLILGGVFAFLALAAWICDVLEHHLTDHGDPQ